MLTFKKKLLLVGAISLFTATMAIGFAPMAPDAHDIPTQILKQEVSITLDTSTQPPPELTDYIHEIRVESNDTLQNVFSRIGINDDELLRFIRNEPEAQGFYKLYAGRVFQASVNGEGKVNWIRYIHTPSTADKSDVTTGYIQAERDAQGQLSVKQDVFQAERQLAMGSGVITSSLFGATDKADIPDAIAIQMAEILSSEIDFHKDLRKNDYFRVVYEVYLRDGQYINSGRVLALEFFNKKDMHHAMWFSPNSDDKGAYYNFEGKNLRKTFTRSPLAFTRITSGFSMRFHPILGTWRAHKGVDYGAPSGTPIMATADGTVTFRGVQNGYGNVVILKHHGVFSTLYAHMSRFPEQLKVGDKVSQGDVIGYVGATGYATGPHLHYEFRVDNVAVDPLTVALPDATPLEGALKDKFFAQTAVLKDQLATLTTIDELSKQVANN